jgi:uncharacterized protein YhaN
LLAQLRTDIDEE